MKKPINIETALLLLSTEELLKPLKERGRFQSPEGVDQYFEEALEKAYNMGREDAIEECIKVVQKKFEWNLKMEKETKSGVGNRDYMLIGHAIFKLKESLIELLNQPN